MRNESCNSRRWRIILKDQFMNSGTGKKLVIKKEIEIRFNEVDSMGLVWHGHYAKYFEDAREEFGKIYGLTYLKIYDAGYYAPLVELNFQYKKPLTYKDRLLTVEIHYKDTPAAKIMFDYYIYNARRELTTIGNSTQVFLDRNYQLVLQNPAFYLDWKSENL